MTSFFLEAFERKTKKNNSFFPFEKPRTSRAVKRMWAFVKSLASWLEDPNNANVLCWNEDGTSFQIKDPNWFMENVYRFRFKAKCYTSFKRQLNMYGFRCRDGMIAHPFFKRDCIDYHRFVKRKGVRFESTNPKAAKAIEAMEAMEAAKAAKAIEAMEAMEAAKAAKAIEAIEAAKAVKAMEALKAIEEAEAAKATEMQRAPNPFEHDNLHLCSTAGLVDFMQGLEFDF
jgi:hypothetical protein